MLVLFILFPTDHAGNSYSSTLPGQPPPWYDPHQQLHGQPEHELPRRGARAAAAAIPTPAVPAATDVPATSRANSNGSTASLPAAGHVSCHAGLRSDHGRSFHVRQYGDASVVLSAGFTYKSNKKICIMRLAPGGIVHRKMCRDVPKKKFEEAALESLLVLLQWSL